MDRWIWSEKVMRGKGADGNGLCLLVTSSLPLTFVFSKGLCFPLHSILFPFESIFFWTVGFLFFSLCSFLISPSHSLTPFLSRSQIRLFCVDNLDRKSTRLNSSH